MAEIQLENGKFGFKNSESDVIYLRPFKTLSKNWLAKEIQVPLKCCKFLFPHLMAAEA